MKKTHKNIWLKTVLPIAAALVLVLGAGWVGATDSDFGGAQRTTGNDTPKMMYSSASSASGSTGGTFVGGLAANYAADKDAYVEEAMYDSVAVATTASREAGAAAAPVAEERKLIRTVNISLRTETFDADVAAIQNLLAQHGGYVENMFQNGEAGSVYGRNASFTMRVPAAQLDAFLSGVKGYGRVTSYSENTEDKTEQYTDNEVRIQTLRTKLERLNTLLGQAELVSDILEIESEIADTQYQLERYETQQLSIDRRVDMSYVYVDINETIPRDDKDDEELTLGQRLAAALKASLEGIVRFGHNLLVFLVMALPVAVPVAVVVLVIWLVRRRNKKNRLNAMRPENEGEAE